MRRNIRKSSRTVSSLVWYTVLGLISLVALLPILYMLANSFMGADEIRKYYGAIFGSSGEAAMSFHILPDEATLDGYYQMLLRRPDYLMKFWNSLFLTISIVIGQVVVSCISAYGFAKFRFPLREPIFFLFIVLMMMPYQVTLVSNYIVLDQMKLIGSYAAIILPGIFGAFGVFLMRQVVASVPDDIIEAAKLDGASPWQALKSITLPLVQPTTLFVLTITMADAFKMVDLILVMTTKGGPNNSTNLLMNHIYQMAFSYWDTGQASVLTICMLGFMLVVALVQFTTMDKRAYYEN